MELKVNITREEEEKIYAKAKDDVRRELTDDAIKEFIVNSRNLNVLELIRTFGIYPKYEEIEDKKLKDLSSNEKMIAVLKWFLYDTIMR